MGCWRWNLVPVPFFSFFCFLKATMWAVFPCHAFPLWHLCLATILNAMVPGNNGLESLILIWSCSHDQSESFLHLGIFPYCLFVCLLLPRKLTNDSRLIVQHFFPDSKLSSKKPYIYWIFISVSLPWPGLGGYYPGFSDSVLLSHSCFYLF